VNHLKRPEYIGKEYIFDFTRKSLKGTQAWLTADRPLAWMNLAE
jgi:hypothetical protein